MLELSKRLFSDFVSFFTCTLYSQISSDFNIPYFIFICVGQNLCFHRLLRVDEVVVFVLYLDYTHFQTNTCRLVPLLNVINRYVFNIKYLKCYRLYLRHLPFLFFTSVLGCSEESASHQHKQKYFLFLGIIEQFKRSYDMVILFIYLN